jgi:hypothetical protein
MQTDWRYLTRKRSAIVILGALWPGCAFGIGCAIEKISVKELLAGFCSRLERVRASLLPKSLRRVFQLVTKSL